MPRTRDEIEVEMEDVAQRIAEIERRFTVQPMPQELASLEGYYDGLREEWKHADVDA